MSNFKVYQIDLNQALEIKQDGDEVEMILKSDHDRIYKDLVEKGRVNIFLKYEVESERDKLKALLDEAANLLLKAVAGGKAKTSDFHNFMTKYNETLK